MLVFFVGEVFLLYFWNVRHPQTPTFFLAIMLIWGKRYTFLPLTIPLLQFYTQEIGYFSFPTIHVVSPPFFLFVVSRCCFRLVSQDPIITCSFKSWTLIPLHQQSANHQCYNVHRKGNLYFVIKDKSLISLHSVNR